VPDSDDVNESKKSAGFSDGDDLHKNIQWKSTQFGNTQICFEQLMVLDLLDSNYYRCVSSEDHIHIKHLPSE
jgi:hypothetical protein